MTKRVFIELLQDRLTGGSATADVIGKFHYGAIEQAIDVVFSDIVSSDRNLAVQMAVPTTVNVVGNKALLSVSPILGMKGVISIEQGEQSIVAINGYEEFQLMKVLNPNLRKAAYSVRGSYMFFKGVEGEVEIGLIPMIASLDDEDSIMVEDFMEVLYMKVAQIMSPMSPKEVYNNQVSDLDKPKA
jgi:hypothetical protein